VEAEQLKNVPRCAVAVARASKVFPVPSYIRHNIYSYNIIII
jgi:hypothetical protein